MGNTMRWPYGFYIILSLFLAGCHVEKEKAHSEIPAGHYELLGGMSTQEWDWLFPFRYGRYNAQGSSYNRGSSACEGLGIHASVEETQACDIYSLDYFADAVEAYNAYASREGKPQFLNEGSLKLQAEELASFLSNISRETSGTWPGASVHSGGWIEDDPVIGMRVWKGGLYWNEEIGHTTNADGTVRTGGVSYAAASTRYPPVSNRSYHGRGPIQLTRNDNYGAFSQWLFDYDVYPDVIIAANTLLRNPGLVSRDPVISFLSAIWFWMTPQGVKPSAHDVILGKEVHVSIRRGDRGLPRLRDDEYGTIPTAFGESYSADVVAYRLGTTINIINGGAECDGASSHHPGPPQRVSCYEAYSAYFNAQLDTNATLTGVGYIAGQHILSTDSDIRRYATCYAQKYYGSW